MGYIHTTFESFNESTHDSMGSILQDYLVAAIWTEEERIEEEDDVSGLDVSDFSEEAINKAKSDIKKFMAKAYELFLPEELARGNKIGHDIWLSRNGHGAGFFDGDYEESDKLQSIAEDLKEVVLEYGDDKKLHFLGGISESVESEEKWIGIDADLETSLYEYGVVVKKPKNRDYPDEWFVLYAIQGDELFDVGWKRESELDTIIKGEEWLDDKGIESFLDTHGMTREEWLELPFITKLHNLISYYGYENIMGTSVQGISRDEADKMLTDNSLNESILSENLEEIKDIAKKQSREEGVVVHVNEIRDGEYKLSDWFDADSTIISYENGIEL